MVFLDSLNLKVKVEMKNHVLVEFHNFTEYTGKHFVYKFHMNKHSITPGNNYEISTFQVCSLWVFYLVIK